LGVIDDDHNLSPFPHNFIRHEAVVEVPTDLKSDSKPKQSVFERMAEESSDCLEDARGSKILISEIRMLDKCNVIFGLFGLMLSTQTYSLEYNLQFGYQLSVMLT
jgi:hypothetical protein